MWHVLLYRVLIGRAESCSVPLMLNHRDGNRYEQNGDSPCLFGLHRHGSLFSPHPSLFFLCGDLSFSLSFTHTHTHTQRPFLTHTRTDRHSLSLSHTHTLSLSVSLSHTHTLSLSHSHTHRHTLSLSHTDTDISLSSGKIKASLRSTRNKTNLCAGEETIE